MQTVEATKTEVLGGKSWALRRDGTKQRGTRAGQSMLTCTGMKNGTQASEQTVPTIEVSLGHAVQNSTLAPSALRLLALLHFLHFSHPHPHVMYLFVVSASLRKDVSFTRAGTPPVCPLPCPQGLAHRRWPVDAPCTCLMSELLARVKRTGCLPHQRLPVGLRRQLFIP